MFCIHYLSEKKIIKAIKLQKNKIKMWQVNKTHSGQFTLSTSQRKEKWAGKKKNNGGGGGVGFPPLSLSLSLFSSLFFS